MPQSSFEDVKLELDEACAFLRSFTLGRAGFTQQDGLAGIQRVQAQCDRLKELFAAGPNAEGVAAAESSARAIVVAARTRLDFLRKRRT
jgi:hypothetical protein